MTTTAADGSDERIHDVEGVSREAATAFAVLSGLTVTKIEELPDE